MESTKYQNSTVNKYNKKSLFLLAASSSSLDGFAALFSSPAPLVLFYLCIKNKMSLKLIAIELSKGIQSQLSLTSRFHVLGGQTRKNFK